MAMSSITVKGIVPSLLILGNFQDFIFDQPTSTFRTTNTFTPTISIPSVTNWEFRNKSFSGFRWIHNTSANDSTGQIKLQSFVNNASNGTDIIDIDQDFNFQIYSRLVIPVGDDSERPVNPKMGTLRLNTITENLEFFTDEWVSVSGGGSGGNGTVTNIETGTGLIGGPITTTGMISLANTAVTPDSYGYASITVDAQGRLTAATSNSSPGEYIIIPTGTTAQRPATGVVGMMRINTTTSLLEYYDGTEWKNNSTITSISGTTNQIDVSASITTPVIGLSNNPIVPGTASITIPVGTTAERPTTPLFGMIRANATTSLLEYYNGANWRTAGETITLTGAVNGTGLGSISTVLSNLINVTGTVQNFIFDSDDFAALKLSSVSAKVELVVNHDNIDVLKIGYSEILGANYIESDVSIIVYNVLTTGRHIFVTDTQNLLTISEQGIHFGDLNELRIQYPNVVARRKIVLWEAASGDYNDHRFTGFGIADGNNTLTYQVGADSGSHRFFAANGNTSSNELFTILGNGNVGISVENPAASLHLANIIANRRIILWTSGDDEHQYTGFGLNGTHHLRYQIADTIGAHIFYTGVTSTDSEELMRITGTGFVGIGTPTPNAPLQFANTTQNRKIVLWEDSDNEHQFQGFGLNGGNSIRYQVGNIAGSHVFYAATSPTSSNELFRITGEGFVGIGTPTPSAPLQFSNDLVAKKIVLSEIANNAYQYTGFNDLGNKLVYHISETAGSHIFVTGVNGSTLNELVRITGQGYVGIGASTPNAPLQFDNIVTQRKIVLLEESNNNHQFIGFGLNSSNSIRYQVSNISGTHSFYAGTNSNQSNELFRIANTYIYSPNNIGIGIDTPNAPLQFSNANNNRKIVLSEVANNINQYNGFGLNTGNVVRYQVADTAGSHRFCTGVDATTSNELFRIASTSVYSLVNIGIGTATANAQLQLGNTVTRRKIVLFEGTNNDYQFIGFGIGGGNTLIHTVGASGGSHIFTAASSATAATELMRITGGGNIGIGTSTPHAPLQFANPGSRRKIVLSETADNDYEFTGFGVVGTALIYNTGVTGAAHVFTTAATATSATELMRITGSGEIIADYIYADVPRFMYRLVNNTTTVTSTANTWIKIAGTTTGSLLNLFTHTDNRATYTGTRTVNMLCNVCATIFTSAGSDVSIRVYKNGTVVTPSQMTNSFTAANLRMNFNTQTIVSMATNDYLEVFIMCNVSGITLNTPFLTFTAHKI